MPDKMQVPDGWQVVRLGDVAHERNQRAHSASQTEVFSVTKHAGFVRSLEYFDRQVFSHDTSNYKVVRRGDLAYATIHLDEGSLGILRYADAGIISPMYTVFEANKAWTEPEFLFSLMKLPQMVLLYQRIGEGTVHRRKSISFERLGRLSFAIPPLTEQRRILRVLDAIDDAIERTEAVITANERLRDALLHELLTRGVPGWHTQWKDAPGLGTIPASWEVVRLGDVAEVRNGTTPSRARLDYWQGDEVPFVKTGKVNDVFIVEPDEFITSQAVTAGAVVVPKSSVLIAMIGQGKTRGMTARLGFDAAINQNFAAVYGADEDFSLEFFFAWARHNYSVIRALGQGSNQDALNCALIEGMRVPKPPVAEQRAIATMLDGVDDAIKRAHEERSGLQSLKASASDALLSGCVRVGGVIANG